MRRERWTILLVLLTCIAASVVCVVYPIYVIRPFRAQGARELAAALFVLRIRPALTLVSATVALSALWFYWKLQPDKWRRSLAIVGAAFTCILAPMARVNIYELMFHPMDRPAFAAAPNAALDQDEVVIAVKIGGNARAYPIRSISYHHIVNDVVGGVPIVATY